LPASRGELYVAQTFFAPFFIFGGEKKLKPH